VFIGYPPFREFLPEHKEIHISCVFTWDIAYCKDLAYQWQAVTDKPVKIGGPAFGSLCDDFNPGMYVKKGVVFTSRGCNNSCGFCMVPKREGKLKELPVVSGNIIQDNNFLQTRMIHQFDTFQMLKTQKNIEFRGGLQSSLISKFFCEQISKLRIKRLYLACDTKESIVSLRKAVRKLQFYGFTREKIHCYVLIGDDLAENEHRLREVYKAGATPFAQLYKTDTKKDYTSEWKRFATQWSSPALIRALMEKGIKYREKIKHENLSIFNIKAEVNKINEMD
jgi:hypothetical protein